MGEPHKPVLRETSQTQKTSYSQVYLDQVQKQAE